MSNNQMPNFGIENTSPKGGLFVPECVSVERREVEAPHAVVVFRGDETHLRQQFFRYL